MSASDICGRTQGLLTVFTQLSQVIADGGNQAVTACKTVGSSWSGQLSVEWADRDGRPSGQGCAVRMDKDPEATGQDAHRLTDLLTRPGGTGETTRDTGDIQRGLRLVSETRRNAGDGGDERRMAHNPEVAARSAHRAKVRQWR
jgi:hypothetical protein